MIMVEIINKQISGVRLKEKYLMFQKLLKENHFKLLSLNHPALSKQMTDAEQIALQRDIQLSKLNLFSVLKNKIFCQ